MSLIALARALRREACWQLELEADSGLPTPTEISGAPTTPGAEPYIAHFQVETFRRGRRVTYTVAVSEAVADR